MAKAKRWEAGTRDAGLAIEYLRTRKVVRLLGWVSDEVIDPVEIPLEELCPRLDMDPRSLGAPLLFLLFAGTQSPSGGGLRDLVRTFDAPEKAWVAFRELRQAHASVPGWAQLATIDPRGRVRQLAWYGLDADAGERLSDGQHLRVVTPS